MHHRSEFYSYIVIVVERCAKMTLLAGWQEGHLTCRSLASAIPVLSRGTSKTTSSSGSSSSNCTHSHCHSCSPHVWCYDHMMQYKCSYYYYYSWWCLIFDLTGLATTRMSPLWILLELRVMELVVTTGAIRSAKLSQNVIVNKPTPSFFYVPDALPVGQQTVLKDWRKV